MQMETFQQVVTCHTEIIIYPINISLDSSFFHHRGLEQYHNSLLETMELKLYLLCIETLDYRSTDKSSLSRERKKVRKTNSEGKNINLASCKKRLKKLGF